VNPVDLAYQCIKAGGHAHLIGAGGIGMAGLAYLLRERGLTVSGCDLENNRQTDWLSRSGIRVLSGHAAEHVAEDVDWIIHSAAVPASHPELRRARERAIPVSRRGEVLPALMRDRTCIAVSGTHGKTTTTAIIAQVLDCGYCIGGEIAGMEAVARDAPLMAVEADESDGTVAGYTPDYAVITNIDYDHMEHHSSEAAFVDCFRAFIENTKNRVFYCGADPVAAEVVQASPAADQCVPFGFPDPALPVPLPGRHNQWNAAAAAAVCAQWKTEEEILQALRRIRPVRRRFEIVYEGGGIRVISDYAHHPTEIAALVEAASALLPRRLLAVFQPHRYTRTRALGAAFPASFSGVDRLWLVPVYAASENPLEGGTTRDLLARFPDDREGWPRCCDSLETAWKEIQAELQEGDLLLIVGAGDIEQLADRARGGS
jgi:UDP-N-acetylmuramate--alanine ligase